MRKLSQWLVVIWTKGKDVTGIRVLPRGQGLVEYILIVALIAVAVVGTVRMFGEKTRKAYQDAAASLYQ